jgi:hypothetical protein
MAAKSACLLDEALVHLLESGLMMSGELSRPDGDFQRKSLVGRVPALTKLIPGG